MAGVVTRCRFRSRGRSQRQRAVRGEPRRRRPRLASSRITPRHAAPRCCAVLCFALSSLPPRFPPRSPLLPARVTPRLAALRLGRATVLCSALLCSALLCSALLCSALRSPPCPPVCPAAAAAARPRLGRVGWGGLERRTWSPLPALSRAHARTASREATEEALGPLAWCPPGQPAAGQPGSAATCSCASCEGGARERAPRARRGARAARLSVRGGRREGWGLPAGGDRGRGRAGAPGGAARAGGCRERAAIESARPASCVASRRGAAVGAAYAAASSVCGPRRAGGGGARCGRGAAGGDEGSLAAAASAMQPCVRTPSAAPSASGAGVPPASSSRCRCRTWRARFFCGSRPAALRKGGGGRRGARAGQQSLGCRRNCCATAVPVCGFPWGSLGEKERRFVADSAAPRACPPPLRPSPCR